MDDRYTTMVDDLAALPALAVTKDTCSTAQTRVFCYRQWRGG